MNLLVPLLGVLTVALGDYVKRYDQYQAIKLPSSGRKIVDASSEAVLVQSGTLYSLYTPDSSTARFQDFAPQGAELAAISKSHGQIVGLLSSNGSGYAVKLANSSASVFVNIALQASDVSRAQSFSFTGDLDRGIVAVYASETTHLFAYSNSAVTATTQLASVSNCPAFAKDYVAVVQNDQRIAVLSASNLDFVDYADVPAGILRVELANGANAFAVLSADGSATVFSYDEYLQHHYQLLVPAGSFSAAKTDSIAYTSGLGYLAEGVGVVSVAEVQGKQLVLLRAGRTNWQKAVVLVRQDVPLSSTPQIVQLSPSGDRLIVAFISDDYLLVQSLSLDPLSQF